MIPRVVHEIGDRIEVSSRIRAKLEFPSLPVEPVASASILVTTGDSRELHGGRWDTCKEANLSGIQRINHAEAERGCLNPSPESGPSPVLSMSKSYLIGLSRDEGNKTRSKVSVAPHLLIAGSAGCLEVSVLVQVQPNRCPVVLEVHPESIIA